MSTDPTSEDSLRSSSVILGRISEIRGTAIDTAMKYILHNYVFIYYRIAANDMTLCDIRDNNPYVSFVTFMVV
jgi:hypothetical protein